MKGKARVHTCSGFDGVLNIRAATEGLLEALVVEFRSHVEGSHSSNCLVVLLQVICSG